MLVWLVFAVLAALVVALVIWPLASERRTPARAAFDRAVYRDQLKEISRDSERGLLTHAEAASARLEVERRLIATADETERRTRPAPRPATRMLMVALAVLVPLGAVAIYLVHGSPQAPDQPYEARAAERAKSTARALLSDPVMVATGIQIIRAIGVKRLLPILAGGLAFGLLAGRSPTSDPTGDEAPAE